MSEEHRNQFRSRRNCNEFDRNQPWPWKHPPTTSSSYTSKQEKDSWSSISDDELSSETTQPSNILPVFLPPNILRIGSYPAKPNLHRNIEQKFGTPRAYSCGSHESTQKPAESRCTILVGRGSYSPVSHLSEGGMSFTWMMSPTNT